MWCKMHLREEASKHLSLMSSFIFAVTFYVFVFKSNHLLLLSFQKTVWHGEQHCFCLHFIKCILALSHLIFSRLCYVKHHAFHLCFSFVNCCFLFRLFLDVTNSTEINGMTWRINVCYIIIMLDRRSSNYSMNAFSNVCVSSVIP